MKALTLWRPWPWAIFHATNPKRVENRGWAPPQSTVGKVIAIHAGKKLETQEAQFLGEREQIIRRMSLDRPPEIDHEGIIGTARVIGCWRSIAEVPLDQHEWWRGPFGWVLGEVQALKEPVPCKGAQGLWDLPANVDARVLAELAR